MFCSFQLKKGPIKGCYTYFYHWIMFLVILLYVWVKMTTPKNSTSQITFLSFTYVCTAFFRYSRTPRNVRITDCFCGISSIRHLNKRLDQKITFQTQNKIKPKTGEIQTKINPSRKKVYSFTADLSYHASATIGPSVLHLSLSLSK